MPHRKFECEFCSEVRLHLLASLIPPLGPARPLFRLLQVVPLLR